MRTMTRPEFEAYEKRVEEALTRLGSSIDGADRADFEDVAAAARAVVAMRRAHLETIERQAAAEPRPSEQREAGAGSDEGRTLAGGTGERYETSAEAAHEALNEIRIAREALGRIAANEHALLPASAYQGDLERGLHMAAYLASWDNQHVHEAARADAELADRIALHEKDRDEHGISYSAGAAGEPIPDVARGNATLLGYYKEGLDFYKGGVAIADHENGLAYGESASGVSFDHWTMEDSDAAWETIDQRRNELHTAFAELERRGETAESETPSFQTTNDAPREPIDADHPVSPAQSGSSLDATMGPDVQPIEREEAFNASYSAGVAGDPIPDPARHDEELLGSYVKGLKQFQTDILDAVDDDQGRIDRDPPGRYWSRENSDSWMTLMQRRDEVIETRAEIARAAESADWARMREEAVARHGEKAVAVGEEFIDRLVVADKEMRDAEVRVGRPREGDKQWEARFEKFAEASARHDEVLRQAVRAAMDGNGYIREARWHGGLADAIDMADLRFEQRSHFYIQNQHDGSRQDEPAERALQSDGAVRSNALPQHTTRLSEIEQEIRDRRSQDRADRDR